MTCVRFVCLCSHAGMVIRPVRPDGSRSPPPQPLPNPISKAYTVTPSTRTFTAAAFPRWIVVQISEMLRALWAYAIALTTVIWPPAAGKCEVIWTTGTACRLLHRIHPSIRKAGVSTGARVVRARVSVVCLLTFLFRVWPTRKQASTYAVPVEVDCS